MNLGSRIFVAGAETLAGRALIDYFQEHGYHQLVGLPPEEPDFTCAGQVEDFFAEAEPEYVFVAAGSSGGIKANRQRPAELMLNNLLCTTSIIDQAYRHGATKLLYLASSCVYPKRTAQPMTPDALMTGPVEPTNDAYATAKLAGLTLCAAYRQQYSADFIGVIPANTFGPYDDFSADSGHVIPALLRRFHEAKVNKRAEVLVWGTGTPRRDFIHSKDLADACVFAMKNYDDHAPLNIGGMSEYSIAETAALIAEVVGFRGRLAFDATQPDGMPRKVLDSSALCQLGWRPKTDFRDALEETYSWFLHHVVREDEAYVRTVV